MAEKHNITTGQKFNSLTIICEAPKLSTNRNRRVSALCDCGNASVFVYSEVFTGRVKCCSRCAQRGPVTHGHTLRKKMSPEYYSWASMRTRCTNRTHKAYPNYGGRGIFICERWESFPCFLEDMGVRPNGTSLDRINNNDGYYKENCRWADKATQSNNRSSNIFYSIFGEEITLAEAAKKFGISYNTLHARVVRFGWDPEISVTKPPRISRYTKKD